VSEGGTPLYAQRLLEQLGQRTPNLPTLDARGIGMVPVILMGDFSAGLVGDPIEARGFAAAELAAVPGNFGAFELEAVSPGGVIIERMAPTPAFAIPSGFDVFTPGARTLTTAPLAILQLGGDAAQSRFRAEVLPAVPPGGVGPWSQQDLFAGPPVRWFLPHLAAITFVWRAPNNVVSLAMVWRELQPRFPGT